MDDDKPFDSLNVVPFIDIMLVLLVMVLTTATFVASGRIPVSLPKATASQSDHKADKTLELGRTGEIALDGEKVTLDQLAERIAGLPPETSFLVRADKDLPLQGFVDVADVLKRAKFSHVALQTQTRSAGEAGPAPGSGR